MGFLNLKAAATGSTMSSPRSDGSGCFSGPWNESLVEATCHQLAGHINVCCADDKLEEGLPQQQQPANHSPYQHSGSVSEPLLHSYQYQLPQHVQHVHSGSKQQQRQSAATSLLLAACCFAATAACSAELPIAATAAFVAAAAAAAVANAVVSVHSSPRFIHSCLAHGCSPAVALTRSEEH